MVPLCRLLHHPLRPRQHQSGHRPPREEGPRSAGQRGEYPAQPAPLGVPDVLQPVADLSLARAAVQPADLHFLPAGPTCPVNLRCRHGVHFGAAAGPLLLDVAAHGWGDRLLERSRPAEVRTACFDRDCEHFIRTVSYQIVSLYVNFESYSNQQQRPHAFSRVCLC